MKFTWRTSDGSRLTWEEGRTAMAGDTVFALECRDALVFAERGKGPSIDLLPPPGGDVMLDLGSVWLVDRWFRQCAALASLFLRSSYIPKDGDIPAEARELLALQEDWFDAANEGIVY